MDFRVKLILIKSVGVFRKKELGGGTVLDLGIYTLQLATLVLGDKPSSVKASGHLNSEGVDMSMSCVLTYANGATAVLSTHAEVELPNNAVIVGTNGSIEVMVLCISILICIIYV